MKFFFHTSDGECYPDEEGTELKSVAEARLEAVKVLGDFLSEKPDDLLRHDRLELTVQDESRSRLFTIHVTLNPA